MTNKIRNIFFLIPLMIFSACAEEDLIIENVSQQPYSGTPVEFDINIYDDIATRGVDNPKTKFSTGDVIHIEAIFYDEDGNVIKYKDNSGQEMESIYKAYELNIEGKWKVIGNQFISWPAYAKTGEFKAFYMSNVKDVLVMGAERKEQRLSDVEDQTDPLKATSGSIAWGHRVNLSFEHLCTHLTFTGLDPDITDYFWLIKKGEGSGLNNVFTLRYTTDGNLEEEFVSKGDDNYGGLVYVQHASRNTYEDNIKTGSEVSFFLEPGDYSNVELRTINNYSYLAYQNDFTSDLQANVPYIVNIKQSKGVTFIEDDDNWDDTETEIDILDPEEFLSHLVEGTEYEVEDPVTHEKRRILQQTATGTLLRYNVSFGRSKNYTPKVIPTGRYFDGGNHYISDLAQNLFTTNSGTIRHLGIKDADCDVELWFESALTENKDSWGVLCEVNQGVIDNIMIEGIDVKFKLGAGKDNSGTRFHLGALAGYNSGTITGVDYGEINISTLGDNDNVNGITNIGGIVGQNTNLIKEVNAAGDNSAITIKPTMTGELQGLYVGGAIGQSSGNIQGVSLPNISIDLSGCIGNISSVGGVVGRLRSTIGTPSELISCTVRGDIKGMNVNAYGTIKAFSYTGGVAGYNYNYNVSNCRAICNVTVPSDVLPSENVSYATGGGFGRIISGNNVISGNYVLGTALSGPTSSGGSVIAYIGNFAGIVPANLDWSHYSAAGNVVNSIVSDNIGASIDDDIPVD